jgi:hypothetical protein
MQRGRPVVAVQLPAQVDWLAAPSQPTRVGMIKM